MYVKIKESDGYMYFVDHIASLIAARKPSTFAMCGMFKLNSHFIEISSYNWRAMGPMLFNFPCQDRWTLLYTCNILIILFVSGCVRDGHLPLHSAVYFIFPGDHSGGGGAGDLLLHCAKFWTPAWRKGIHMHFVWLQN